MNKNSKYEDEVTPYERQLARSFNFVIREADQLYQGQGRLRKTYDRLTNRLEALGVAYGVVGGYALIVHGVRRFTEDIDILVSGEGLDRLHKQLIGLGYVRVAPGSRNLRDVETGVKIEFIVAGESSLVTASQSRSHFPLRRQWSKDVGESRSSTSSH